MRSVRRLSPWTALLFTGAVLSFGCGGSDAPLDGEPVGSSGETDDGSGSTSQDPSAGTFPTDPTDDPTNDPTVDPTSADETGGCGGCLDASGACQLGIANDECGVLGETCAPCDGSTVCDEGACVEPPAPAARPAVTDAATEIAASREMRTPRAVRGAGSAATVLTVRPAMGAFATSHANRPAADVVTARRASKTTTSQPVSVGSMAHPVWAVRTASNAALVSASRPRVRQAATAAAMAIPASMEMLPAIVEPAVRRARAAART